MFEFIKKYYHPESKFFRRILIAYSLTATAILIFVISFNLGSGLVIKQLRAESVATGQVENKESVPEFLNKDVNFEEFWQVWQYVKENYVKPDISDTQLFYGAMSGLVASLDDPYSVFFDPEINKKFEEELSGSFEGIGAEIALKDGVITVVAPLPGTPAEIAGLKPGDKVLAIDGKDTGGMALDYAVSIIRGKKGTTVKLTILSNGDDKPRDVELVRDTIKIESVKFNRKSADAGSERDDKTFDLKDGDIAYIQLMYFNEDTLADWNQTVVDVLGANPKGIILDLRNNPGGLLSTAIEVAGDWINGKTVVSEQLRSGEKLDHHASRQAHFAAIPTVVLVNQGSASGSEIVAGALQDYGVAKIVGETTFGKGSVQDLRNFGDGSAVKLTIAEWLTPNGKNINKAGIKPDIEVKLTKEDFDADKDPQLEKALEILKQ